MARGTLHAGKPDGQRRRRNAPTHDVQVVTDDGQVRGPELAVATGRDEWPTEVVSWYETWRRAPQAALFEATDWARLAMLAPIVAAYWRRPSAAALSEIRMNEERLGATVTDRMRARIRIERDTDETAGLAPVVGLPSARDEIAARLRGETR